MAIFLTYDCADGDDIIELRYKIRDLAAAKSLEHTMLYIVYMK